MKPEEFWQMGFDEYYHYFTGYMKKKRDNNRFLAYLTALQMNIMISAWSSEKSKKLIEVDDIMGERSESIEKTTDNIIEKMKKEQQELDRIFNSPSIGNTGLDRALKGVH